MKTIKLLLTYVVVGIISIMSLSSCTDEPKSNPRFNIEEIAKYGVWETADVYYVGSNGKTFTTDELHPAGSFFGITFSIEDGKLTDILRNSPYINSSYGKFTKYVYPCQYNSQTGELHINNYGLDQKYLKIISFDRENETLVVHARFGEYVYEYMLEEDYDPLYYYKYFSKLDTGAYAVVTLKPVKDGDQLSEITSAHTVTRI